MKRCPKCGAEYAEKARFCPIDGTGLGVREEAAPVIVNTAPPAPLQPPVEPQKMPTPKTASSLRVNKQCAHCGSQYVERMVFCPRDGKRLERIPEPGEAGFFPAYAQSSENALSTEPDPLLGRTIADHYKLVAKIGQGGMGVVYKAEHVRITRPSAIKILNPEYAGNPEFVARFGREAELASRINHPNAVGIYDVGEEEDGLVYIAMEYVDGELLSKIIKREGPLTLDRVVKITRQVADALDAAHELDIVHRDLKPDNIMICQRRGKNDWVKVVDFGIAKRAHHGVGYQNLTRRGLVLGTPEYMAPEQLLREPLDIRSDIYSLGLVAYRMLTGKLPFEGPTPQSRMIKKLTDPPLSLKSVRPQLRVSPQVEAVIMKALATDRRNRYPTSVEFAAALERAAESNAVYAVLAGDEGTSWDIDEAETQASESASMYTSPVPPAGDDAANRYQSQMAYPQQFSGNPPPGTYPAVKTPDSIESSEGRFSDNKRPKTTGTTPAAESRPDARQPKIPETPNPAIMPAAEERSLPPRPVYDPERSYPSAPPAYSPDNRAAYENHPGIPYLQPPTKGGTDWRLYVVVIFLVFVAIVVLLAIAMWVSGSGPSF
jgi:serine/threonine-protein kinase